MTARDPMTADEFRAELRRLDLTQAAASRLLERDPRTVRRYCAGTLEIPKVVRLALIGLEQEGFAR